MALGHHGQAWRIAGKTASHLRVMRGGLPPGGGDGDTETLQRRLQGTQAFFPPTPVSPAKTQGRKTGTRGPVTADRSQPCGQRSGRMGAPAQAAHTACFSVSCI